MGTGTTQGLLGVNSFGGTAVSVSIGGAAAWASASVMFTTGASNTSATIYCENPGTSDVYFDDLNLVEPPVLTGIANAFTPISTAKSFR